MTFRHNGCGGTTMTPTLGDLLGASSYPAGPGVSGNPGYFPQITISRMSAFLGRMSLPPKKRGIWRQRIKNRLTEKRDIPKVKGSCYNQQNAVFGNDFRYTGQ